MSGSAAVGESVGGARARAAAGEKWVARAQTQIEDVEHIVRTVQAEANAFATSIAAGADAISDARDISPVSEIVAVARAMVARTRVLEARLEAATRAAQVRRRQLD